jgi:DNA polymerase III alpha subunit
LSEDSGLRFGLLNIAGCGESAAVDIVAKRPYDSYEDFIERTNSRSVKKNIVDSMDKVGCFDSLGWNSQYEKERYYGPILSYPINLNDSSPFDDIIAPCAEANSSKEDSDLFVIRGVVKSAKRTPKYFRVEIEDSDGVCSSFADKDSAEISKRDYIIALVGDQTIHHYDDFFAVESGESETDFAKFLKRQIDPEENLTPFDYLKDHGCGYEIVGDKKTVTMAYLLSVVRFQTKSGVSMGSCYLWNPELGNFKATVFANMLESSKERYLKPFEWVLIKTSQNPRRKEFLLENIISCEQYVQTKGLQP